MNARAAGAGRLALAAVLALPPATAQEGVVLAEFVFDEAPTRGCHASTLVETDEGLVAAWFGGTHEGHPDVGIWVARRDARGWSAPAEVADGVQHAGLRHPTWNPVLFRPRGGPLLLFYKCGPSPRAWWGMLTTSDDGGATWSWPRRLPEDILGPVKNKPLEMDDGALLCGSSDERAGWRVHFERTADRGRTWERTAALHDGETIAAIQPAVVRCGDRLLALCRTQQRRIARLWSDDGGRTWSEMELTDLPNSSTGIDAVALHDGRVLLVYNHSEHGRTPLNVAVSADGETWRAAAVLEDAPGEYSYPAVIQTADRRVHVTYTHRRRAIRHVVLDPDALVLRDMPGGVWPR